MIQPFFARSSYFLPWISAAALAVAFLAGLPGRATAATVALTPNIDNTMYGTGDESDGLGNHLFAGLNGQSETLRSLIRFDVAGSVPAGATINSVSPTLTIDTPSSHSATVELHRLTASWGEGTSNDGLSSEGGGGSGSPATTGDATWNFVSSTRPRGRLRAGIFWVR